MAVAICHLPFAMNIKPFHFKLSKVSGAEQRVLSALFDFLPKTGMREKFHEAIHEALEKHLGLETHYLLESVNQDTFDSFLERLPDTTVLVVLGMAPRQGKIILEIDEHLAALFIEKLLGGSAETMPTPRPLSDTEQGVLQYLILQVLAHLHHLCGGDARLHFRFEKFVFSPKGLKGIVSPNEPVSGLTVKMTVGNHGGFVKLVFPSPVIEQQYLNVVAKGEARPAEKAYLMDRLEELSFVAVPLWAEVGHTTVTTGDMKNLEVGDVVVFDATQISLSEGVPQGRAILCAGEGRHGGFVTEISVAPKKVQCRIVDVKKGEEIKL